MNYGFVIDNRMCIGCHACTVVCKSEHDVPIGVNRTHVKYIEKGIFPNNTREFSVHRCNHCAKAPCVEICPTAALYSRGDGIVDFDKDRCIGCKSCMQACPYDALYIDPNTHTAAKCNYCAHRLDRGYEPACVVICPVEAIVSGDLNDPNSKIAQLVANEDTMTRKPEKGTKPELFYVNGTQEMLDPNATKKESEYLWSEQFAGVGHFAKYAESRASKADMKNLLVQLATEKSDKIGEPIDNRVIDNVVKEIQQDVDTQDTRRVYDSPSKGVLWRWEVSAYVWTKAIATGTFLMMAVLNWFNGGVESSIEWNGLVTTLVFLGLTGGLLVKDLDRPDRFLYVLLRPQWKSWLVRGAYIISGFGGIVAMKLLDNYFDLGLGWLMIPGAVLAIISAVYTAFLFAQARARDLWQSSVFSSVQMLVHSIMAGSVMMIIISSDSIEWMRSALLWTLIMNLILITKEVLIPHRTKDAQRAIQLMTKGYYSKMFLGSIFLGNILPIVLLNSLSGIWVTVAGGFALIGIYLAEFLRIRVPQLISLS